MASTLEGLQVLDLSTGIAGPYATKLLADYGARVIKIEHPLGGDPTRSQGPFLDDVPHPEKSGLFLFLNTGKESITLNLETAAGLKLFHLLAAEADVIVESFSPAKAISLGVSYDVLQLYNSALVVTSFRDFGSNGPYRDHKLTDLTAFAATGFMYTMGEPDRPPVRPGGPFSGFITGLSGCFATLVAYLTAMSSGRGQQAEVSTLEAVLSTVIYDTTSYSYTGEVRKRLGNWNSDAIGVGLSIQPTRDGYIGFLVGPGYERWRNLWEVLLDRPDVLEDPRFLTPEGQLEHGRELEIDIRDALQDRDSEELFHAAQALRLLFGQILTTKDLFHNDHLRARNYFAKVQHPAMGSVELPGLPWRFSETPSEGLGPPPTLGQHNKLIYMEQLGLNGEDLTRLRACGAI